MQRLAPPQPQPQLQCKDIVVGYVWKCYINTRGEAKTELSVFDQIRSVCKNVFHLDLRRFPSP